MLKDHKVALLFAWQYLFQWDSKTRVAILIEKNGTTLVVFFDENPPINAQILLTLELVA